MDVATIARWRLRNLGLARPAHRSPAHVLDGLVAVQAQDLFPARWSLAQRCAAVARDADVAAAHDAGDFLRTHVLRPTWHFVAASELAMVLAATSARVHQVNKHMYGRTGVDGTLMSRVVRPVLDRLLTDGPATRSAVRKALVDAGVEAEGTRLALVLMWAELEGWIASGPTDGNQQTYALLTDAAAKPAVWGTEHAQAELALRYFRSRGPATPKDFAVWSSLTLTQARRAVAAVAEQLDTLEVDGRTYWFIGAPPEPGAPVVSLVQAYDEIVMSYGETRDVLTGGITLWDLPSRRFMHPVLLDGRLVGHWRYERDGRGRPAILQVRLERPREGNDQPGLAAELDRFAGFVGHEVELLEG